MLCELKKRYEQAVAQTKREISSSQKQNKCHQPVIQITSKLDKASTKISDSEHKTNFRFQVITTVLLNKYSTRNGRSIKKNQYKILG